MLKEILCRRDLPEQFNLADFLAVSLKQLQDPSSLKDMDSAVDRIIEAILSGEIIGIFGDYDVDGVCATALLAENLRALGAKVTTTIPHRLQEGYGLSTPGIDRLKQNGARLLITVDCGITAFDAVEYAKKAGMTVVIVDHHKALPTLPKAFAIVNPHRQDCSSNLGYLCATGVAFFLCMALWRKLRKDGYFQAIKEPDLRQSLDLVALATVCDVMPLINENRILVKAGIRRIKDKPRAGMKALLQVAKVELCKVSSTNLGFYIGPRINAAGRLEDAQTALNLLMSDSEKQATELATYLDNQNQERREIEQATVQAVCDEVEGSEELKNKSAIVVHNEGFHPGVVGIVASRIVEKYHRPAIIIGQNGKGSGRSIKGVDLYEMVSLAQTSLKGFGGHAHAVGVTLGETGVRPFQEELWKVMAETVNPSLFTPIIFYDVRLMLNDVSAELIDELALLEPFGARNPHPLFRFDHCFMRNIRELEGGHIKGQLESSTGVQEFIGFRMALKKEWAYAPVDVLAYVDKNVWRDRETLQLRLVDVKIAEDLKAGAVSY